MSNRINLIKPINEDLINFIPPSLFNVKISLVEKGRSKQKAESESFFESLSSGEQQLVHTVQSIIYHLNNVNSVFKQPDKNKRVEYENINIILDEIELYFHPDYQRKFIFALLESIKRTKLEHIKSINFLFLTHSPFILSDIPSANILKLDEGIRNLEPMKTFGANVYDLLAESFFLSESCVGELAESKIRDTIKWLNTDKNKEEAEYYQQIIKIIDEPIVQRKLAEMYDNKMESSLQLRVIRDQIEKLENLTKKIK